MQNKRYNFFVGSIICLICSLVGIFILFVDSSFFSLNFSILLMLFFITSIFNFYTLKTHKLTESDFSLEKGSHISTFVVNFAFMVVFLLCKKIIGFLIFMIFLTGNVLMLVDFFKNISNKKGENLQMKRGMFLAGAIIALVTCSISLLSSTVTFFSLIDYFDLLSSAYIFGLILGISLEVLAVIFNAESISAWKLSKTRFKKQKGYVITAIVFNFIIIGIYFLSFFTLETLGSTILPFLALLTGTILLLVDFCREKNKKDPEWELENAKTETTAKQETDITIVEQKAKPVEQEEKIEEKPEPKKVKSGESLLTLESKLIKLNEMKEQGLIDQDEYNEIKKSYIKEEIKK